MGFTIFNKMGGQCSSYRTVSIDPFSFLIRRHPSLINHHQGHLSNTGPDKLIFLGTLGGRNESSITPRMGAVNHQKIVHRTPFENLWEKLD